MLWLAHLQSQGPHVWWYEVREAHELGVEIKHLGEVGRAIKFGRFDPLYMVVFRSVQELFEKHLHNTMIVENVSLYL